MNVMKHLQALFNFRFSTTCNEDQQKEYKTSQMVMHFATYPVSL